jgi:hypothetical protein
MAIVQEAVRNALVFRDNVYTHRWFDAFGENVTKYTLNTAGCPTDDTTGMPTEWTNTLVNGSTFAHTDVAGGAVLLTTDTAENDGIKLQLGDELAGAGESIDLSARYPLYCGIDFAINDVDQTDFLFGVSLTDTTVLDGADTAMYFRSVDESAALYFVTEKDTVESATAVATMADGAYITAEFLYGVDGTVRAYINGTEQTSTADSAATFPNDELMRLTLEFLTGEAIANTCTIRWLRMIHIR